MPLRFFCRNCQVKIRVPDGSAGRSALCPRCNFEQRVPEYCHLEAGDSAVADAVTSDAMGRLAMPPATQSGAKFPLQRAADSPLSTPKPTAIEAALQATSREPTIAPQASVHSPQGHDAPDPESGGMNKNVGKPPYVALLFLAWLFRALAVVTAVIEAKRVTGIFESDTDLFNRLRAIVLGLALASAMCLVGELARILRDITRNSYRR